ncbi:MAG: hypothetical protein ACYC5K_08415 [Saccharofermentanales bacterium]
MDNNKLSSLLIGLTKKIKMIYMIFAVYFATLILYDLIAFGRPLREMIITYSIVIIIGTLIWFSLRFIFWLQIKNVFCPQWFFNTLSFTAIIVFGISSLIVGIQYFMDGFLIAAFIAPIAFTSVVGIQTLRGQPRKDDV